MTRKMRRLLRSSLMRLLFLPGILACGSAMAKPDGAPLEHRYSLAFNKCLNTGAAIQGSIRAMLACTEDEIDVQDRLLNRTYNTLMTRLPSEKQVNLRNTERAWIERRDRKCPAGDAEMNGQLALLDRPSCVLDETIRRTMALEKLGAAAHPGH